MKSTSLLLVALAIILAALTGTLTVNVKADVKAGQTTVYAYEQNNGQRTVHENDKQVIQSLQDFIGKMTGAKP